MIEKDARGEYDHLAKTVIGSTRFAMNAILKRM